MAVPAGTTAAQRGREWAARQRTLAHNGGRGSPIGGDAPGREQRFSAGVSSEASSRTICSKPGGFVTGETLVFGSLADIAAASGEHNSVARHGFVFAGMAALIEVDGPPAYLANAEAGSLRKKGDPDA